MVTLPLQRVFNLFMVGGITRGQFERKKNQVLDLMTQDRHRLQHIREPDWEKEVKKDVPEFTSNESPDEIVDWLTLVNEVFEHRNVPENRRVGIIAMRFRGKAIAWWRREKQTRQAVGKAQVTSWRKMEGKIQKYFLPKGYKRELYQRYQNLKQGTRTVDQYTNEFNELVIRNNIQDPEEVLVNKYLNGLQFYIQDALEVLDIWDLGDAHQRALKMERSHSRRQQSASKPSTQPHDSKQPATSEIRCYSCGELGHRASNCRINKNRPAGKAFLVDNNSDENTEDPLEEELKNDEEAADDEQIVHADTGELLMVRKNFPTPRDDTGDRWLRTNIFHSACTIMGKVCQLIIDSGCCENIISEVAANKLKLELKAHPTPYKMLWLKIGAEVTISKRCLVNLSIGSVYSDKIWCDVLPMDASHIILGQPWQFDKRTMHDGYRNTYSFEFGGKKITLAPSRVGDSSDDAGKNSRTNSFKDGEDDAAHIEDRLSRPRRSARIKARRNREAITTS
ncbi:uncharacterized protein LOC120291138 [Eucalyptus grandis]|uniref:uncharacterized protein LOC120291138 n=1 Tax=Eucalyptus grandis TaxID=71139 RepID=UPI00192E7930|nr:uncharacterized protein LOC120291138 [Eucalyptus grandis]